MDAVSGRRARAHDMNGTRFIYLVWGNVSGVCKEIGLWNAKLYVE